MPREDEKENTAEFDFAPNIDDLSLIENNSLLADKRRRKICWCIFAVVIILVMLGEAIRFAIINYEPPLEECVGEASPYFEDFTIYLGTKKTIPIHFKVGEDECLANGLFTIGI